MDRYMAMIISYTIILILNFLYTFFLQKENKLLKKEKDFYKEKYSEIIKKLAIESVENKTLEIDKIKLQNNLSEANFKLRLCRSEYQDEIQKLKKENNRLRLIYSRMKRGKRYE